MKYKPRTLSPVQVAQVVKGSKLTDRTGLSYEVTEVTAEHIKFVDVSRGFEVTAKADDFEKLIATGGLILES